MMIKSLMTALVLYGTIFSTTVLTADDAPAAPRKKMQGKRNMRRGGGQMRFDPMMMLAFQVKDELKAYNANKTDENYKKLEAAVKKASDKMATEFLKKAKDGELKFPQRPDRKRGGRGGKRGGKRPAPQQD